MLYDYLLTCDSRVNDVRFARLRNLGTDKAMTPVKRLLVQGRG